MPPNLSYNRKFGFHYLAECGLLENNEDGYGKLRKAAKIAARVGAKLFELPSPPICEIPADIVARILIDAEIREVAYCVLFPLTPEGKVPFGDPLSKTPAEVALATETFRKHLEYIRTLQANGITVKYMTGPSCFALGREYGDPLFNGNRSRQELNEAIVSFYSQFTEELKKMGVTVCIEYLRQGEDRGALENVETVIAIIDLLGGLDSPFRFHADVVHMLERGHNPEEVLRRAGKYLGYLHAHGPKRVAPGTYGLPEKDGELIINDTVNWYRIGKILDEIGYVGPVVPEPFGKPIRDAINALGEGMPLPVDAEPYYVDAYTHLSRSGVIG